MNVAWWVAGAEIEGSKAKGACAMLEIASNGIFVTIGDDEEEDDGQFNVADM